MISLGLNSAQLIQFRRTLRRLEEALRFEVAVYAFVIAALALALVGLLELEAIKEPIERNHLGPLSKILQAILEGTASAIIIYYLIDRRLGQIRKEITENLMLIGKRNILSAIFDVNLDTGTVEAWQKYILEQKLSVRLARLDLFFIRRGNGVLVSFKLNEDIVVLESFDKKKIITLGTSESEAWTITAFKVTNKIRPEESVEYHASRAGPKKEEYNLKVYEQDQLTRELECERYFSGIVTDNHVFADGAQKVVFHFHIDEYLHERENLWKNPIELVLPQNEEESDWMEPVTQSDGMFQDTQFTVYRCNPKCVFLPHQGFTYHLATESRSTNVGEAVVAQAGGC
jgi:hypothetical protein